MDFRVWDGMNFSGWLRMMSRNRFAVSPSRVAMSLIVGALGPMHASLWALQKLLYGRKIEQTEIREHPIFILGHWRSGTTYLHELLVTDSRHTFANTYNCFSPNHFLVSSGTFKRCFSFLLPKLRPMDNMPLGFDRPQEDEFALCNMGIGSPYLTFAFSNRPPQDQEYLDMEGLSPGELARWKRAFLWFLKCVTVQDPKRIVLKSPPHTGRIRVLLELFPDARFVHITRDPYVLFPSTVNLFRRLYRREGLQVPRYEGLEEHVFTTLNRMYAALDRDRPLVDDRRFCEVRYEDLVQDPIEQMRTIYDQLELGDFDKTLPVLKPFVESRSAYKKNRYEITPETRAEIARRWRGYIERYGYSSEGGGI